MMLESFSFSGTFYLTRRKEEKFVWQRAASLSANKTVSHGIRTFGELYVISPVELGEGNQWVVDGGLMRPIGRNIMVDGSVGRSVHGPRDWFVAVGFSIRTRTPGFGGLGGR